ncbi:hypothetical protein DEU56DRAFT_753528 [Suillus clintonianus]|uniref:uncharacterized protein n=1 Tax=Suillus clintonianus TaxID=1904413 RepID=UPI001B86D4DC|nr:uncharacterized protein DEU56DRAFT_753528 [Suillus clintonianus]KAG2147708.1 hypothetical protein DEU56DRAFT_753528 [Suillus clintonianus]
MHEATGGIVEYVFEGGDRHDGGQVAKVVKVALELSKAWLGVVMRLLASGGTDEMHHLKCKALEDTMQICLLGKGNIPSGLVVKLDVIGMGISGKFSSEGPSNAPSVKYFDQTIQKFGRDSSSSSSPENRAVVASDQSSAMKESPRLLSYMVLGMMMEEEKRPVIAKMDTTTVDPTIVIIVIMSIEWRAAAVDNQWYFGTGISRFIY